MSSTPQDQYLAVCQELERLRAELAAARARSEWMLHNAGLLNEWAAKEWRPDKHPPLIEWLRQRIDAALAGERK